MYCTQKHLKIQKILCGLFFFLIKQNRLLRSFFFFDKYGHPNLYLSVESWPSYKNWLHVAKTQNHSKKTGVSLMLYCTL